jgi:hypothetical protein
MFLRLSTIRRQNAHRPLGGPVIALKQEGAPALKMGKCPFMILNVDF